MPQDSIRVTKHALSAVAGAAIPAVVLGSLAAAPAQASQVELTKSSVLTPKSVSPQTVKIAEEHIKAHLLASRIPTLGLPAQRQVKEIKVPSGASLWSLAREYDSSVSELKKINDLDSDLIREGQKLKVPGKNSSSEKKTAKNTRGAASSESYTVKAGDTMGHIAHRLDVSLSEVRKAAGNPSGDRIYVGQKLNFGGSSTPSKSSPKKDSGKTTGGSYTVKSGDTLGAIAARNGISLSKLMSMNNLSSKSLIFPGDKLKLSGSAQSSSPKPTSQSNSAPKSSGTSSYSVKSGDTLGGIAAKHGISLSRLLDLNPEVSTQTPLQINTKLKVSGSSVKPNAGVKPTQKIGNTFAGRTYPDATVRSANENKAYLDSISVPSRSEMQALIRSTAKSMGVDPALALAHAQQESGFNQRAVSPANAIGAMQVIPSTGEWMSGMVGRKLNLLDPRDNVAAGVATIKYNLDNAESLDHAIAAYYQGLGGVRKYGMYSDTKVYVANVKSLMKQYR